jgi:methylglyoxal synthase
MSEPIVMPTRKRIAVIAHDNKKTELINCLKQHQRILSQHELFGTGTTGSLVEKELNLPVTKFRSGPLGGDQQLGAKIASQELDMVFFLIDPLYSHPHNADIQALLRLAQVWNIVCATTVTSIDFILTSPKMNESYTRNVSLTPIKPKEKLTSIQTRHVPSINENLQFILARLFPKR